jgi:PAS domain S-box-containing protein
MANSTPTSGNAFTQLLITILEPAAEAVTVANRDGIILEANGAVEKVYRLKKKDIIGRHPITLCPNTPQWKNLSQTIWKAIKTTGKWDGVVINKELKNSKEFPILLRTRKIKFKGVEYVISWARPFPEKTPFGLSSREQDCFDQIGKGLTISEAAGELGIKNSTVMTHLQRIWSKTGETQNYNTAAIVNLAVRCYEAGYDHSMKLNQEWIMAQS